MKNAKLDEIALRAVHPFLSSVLCEKAVCYEFCLTNVERV